MPISEIVERFTLEGVNRSPAKFDAEKCAWINQQHLAQMSDSDFAHAAAPFVQRAGYDLPDNFTSIAASVQEKTRLLSEVPGAIAFLLDEDFAYDQDTLDKVRNNEAAKNLLGELALAFNQVDDWSSSKEAIAATAKANGTKPGQLMFPTRVALSGQSGGPDLGAILEILGKDESIRRIRRTISQL